MRCSGMSRHLLTALLGLGLGGAIPAFAYDPKPVPVGRYSRTPTCAAPQPEPSCEAPQTEPNCAAPQRQPCPCPPPQPQSAPPEYFAPQGVFVQPPPSGTVRGPVNQTGIEGASLTFPEVTIRMPSLRFPALSRFRSNARMEMDQQSAPYVEQPAAPMQAAPAAAPAQAPPAAPAYTPPQAAPAYAYAPLQPAPAYAYAPQQAAPQFTYAAPQAVITIPAQAMPQQAPLTYYAVPAPAAPQPAPAAAPVPTPPAEAPPTYRAPPQADPAPYYRAPNCAAPDDLDAKLKRLEDCERRIQLQLEAIQRALERQADPNCAAPHRLGMAPQPLAPLGGQLSPLPAAASPLPPVEQGTVWRPAYGAQPASYQQEPPRQQPIREPGRFQPLR